MGEDAVWKSSMKAKYGTEGGGWFTLTPRVEAIISTLKKRQVAETKLCAMVGGRDENQILRRCLVWKDPSPLVADLWMG